MPLSADDLAAIYVQEEARLLAYCRRRLGDPHAAEDAACAVWEELVRIAATYEDRGYAVSALLYRIAQSKCVDYWRAQHSRPTVPLAAAYGRTVCDTAADARIDALAALTTLARQNGYYAAVLLFRAQGGTLKELAAHFGITLGATKALLHRARASARAAANA